MKTFRGSGLPSPKRNAQAGLRLYLTTCMVSAFFYGVEKEFFRDLKNLP
jgi:hypothetical protein